jgi:hypothetical protein
MAAQGDGYARYVVPMDSVGFFYDEPGAPGWIMEGFKHGFELTSVVITSTEPRGARRCTRTPPRRSTCYPNATSRT